MIQVRLEQGRSWTWVLSGGLPACSPDNLLARVAVDGDDGS